MPGPRQLRGIFGVVLERLLRRPTAPVRPIPAGSYPAVPGHPSAQREAARYADALRRQGRPATWVRRTWPPTVAAAARDRRTGAVHVGFSAEPGVDVPPALRSRLPEPSTARWASDNCGEVKAASKAIAAGSRLEDLDIAAVRVNAGTIEPPCSNCQHWIPKGRS